MRRCPFCEALAWEPSREGAAGHCNACLRQDNRYWITDPRGHRAAWLEEAMPHDGELIETAFGPAENIVLPPPPADDWACDYCSEPLLVRWGPEPWPVPMSGSYALCRAHQERSEADEGPWPWQTCGCEPCVRQLGRWLEASGWRGD